MKKELLLKDVVFDMSINPRHEIDPLTVEKYADILDELPLMDVFSVNGKYILASGFHRFRAHQEAGRDTAFFYIHDGDIQSAFRFSCKSNAKHGLRLTIQETWDMAEKIIRDDPHINNSILTNDYGVSARMIREIRAKLRQELPNLPTGSDNGIIEPVAFVNPYEAERHWSLYHFSLDKRRTKSTLVDRLTPCQFCGWPITQNAHLLDFHVWGSSADTHTARLCTRCHETYDIWVKAIEKIGKVSPTLMGWIQKKRPEDDVITKISKKAKDMVVVRKTLYDSLLEKQKNHHANFEEIKKYIEGKKNDK